MTYIPYYLDLGIIRASTVVASTSVYAYATANPSNSTTCEQFTTLSLDISFTKATITSIELIIEGKNDESSSVWYPYSIGAFSSPVETVEKDVLSLVASKYGTTDTISIPVSINHKYIRVGVKGTGTLTSSLVEIKASLIRK